MPGPAPAANRRRRNAPARGDWRSDQAIGWQHGEVPPPPARLNAAAKVAWATWMAAWFAAHWTPDDIPGLRVLSQLYSFVASGKAKAGDRSELRQQMDAYGITPKGQQDRRWQAPGVVDPAEPVDEAAVDGAGPYAHLRVVESA